MQLIWRVGLRQSLHVFDGSYVILCLATLLSLSAASRGDYVTLVDNGPSSNRVDVVVLGDGYTADQIETDYTNHIRGLLDYMFRNGQDPYPRYANFFNIHRVDVISRESGADIPPEEVFRDTALDATYYYDNANRQSLYVDTTAAYETMREALRDAPFYGEVRLVVVNSSDYGGGSGLFSVFAAGSHDLALHELGHSFNDLGDEYGGVPGPYEGSEPREPNLTTSPEGEKWSQWIGYDQPGIGVIGAYEGGRYYDRGIYRPSLNSRMRTASQPFDAVSREKIILDIYDLVDPLDDWLDNSAPLSNPDSLWVDVIDPEVIQVDWYVDGELTAENAGERLALAQLGLAPGTHEVTAIARDPTDWVRRHRERLKQEMTWNVIYTAPAPVPQPLMPGDADQDADMDQFDLIQVLQAAKYLTGLAATWGEGDWNGAPGGTRGEPPPGDGVFDQWDIVAALAQGQYLTGPYTAYQPDRNQGGDQTSIGYEVGSGDVWIDSPRGIELTSVDIDSAAGDLTVVGSLAGGGDLFPEDVIDIPEPSTMALLVLGAAGMMLLRRRQRS